MPRGLVAIQERLIKDRADQRMAGRGPARADRAAEAGRDEPEQEDLTR